MDNLDPRKIGLELKRLRTERSYTQEQVANDLGCTVSFISNVENNRVKLNLRVLTYYARLCNVTVDSILSAGKKDGTEDDDSRMRDAELLNIFHQFSKQEQEKILKTLKYVRELE